MTRPISIVHEKQLVKKIVGQDLDDSAFHCTRWIAFKRLMPIVGADFAVKYIERMDFKIDQYHWDCYPDDVTTMIHKICDKLLGDVTKLTRRVDNDEEAFHFMLMHASNYSFTLQA